MKRTRAATQHGVSGTQQLLVPDGVTRADCRISRSQCRAIMTTTIVGRHLFRCSVAIDYSKAGPHGRTNLDANACPSACLPSSAHLLYPTNEPQKVTLKVSATDVIAISGTGCLCCRWAGIHR